jgi:hypothetical protein
MVVVQLFCDWGRRIKPKTTTFCYVAEEVKLQNKNPESNQCCGAEARAGAAVLAGAGAGAGALKFWLLLPATAPGQPKVVY